MSTVRLDDFGRDLGLVHEAIVTGRKVGTPSELQAFFARLAHDEDMFRSVMDNVLNRVGMTEAERMALEILGPGKVLGYQDVCRVWQADLPETEPATLFTEDILSECANDAGVKYPFD